MTAFTFADTKQTSSSSPLPQNAAPVCSQSYPHIWNEPDASFSQHPSNINSEKVALVCPRRKKNPSAAKRDAEDPVVLTRELLESLFSLPLSSASERLGICPTAIKKACRKLGIPKWPFKNQSRRGACQKQVSEASGEDKAVFGEPAPQAEQGRANEPYHTVSAPDLAAFEEPAHRNGESEVHYGMSSFQPLAPFDEGVLFLKGSELGQALMNPLEEDLADEMFWKEIERVIPAKRSSAC
ncbi:hypothetical protein GUITHDRAFT_115168 [Guillardia theta CCMP2712]|uniref:RWP-RK domain-containing protein n=2 Tax=Guillardia theta TaxID=55529 RepID=L1IS17_GUITC|nr:hypothetical protein GUITHDRAFT_115168 [Guillardia theta CCMP2712]EKX38620.1 hypothetical protein GUITHDRAFT_115168 [Guillardia theta CCMP2712]|mmetsp:Transcript_27265/g.89035  ORF Transcript_27265/g.89035 Transcript_27265/m.89035 type:complete len:240 (+) Transcript_27265:85-804(+)|eukprot:XP_005825600.1 hypothetical protein GUITHDRAFT_115168 [Guillardia theta CCMP2712]